MVIPNVSKRCDNVKAWVMYKVKAKISLRCLCGLRDACMLHISKIFIKGTISIYSLYHLQ